MEKKLWTYKQVNINSMRGLFFAIGRTATIKFMATRSCVKTHCSSAFHFSLTGTL